MISSRCYVLLVVLVAVLLCIVDPVQGQLAFLHIFLYVSHHTDVDP